MYFLRLVLIIYTPDIYCNLHIVNLFYQSHISFTLDTPTRVRETTNIPSRNMSLAMSASNNFESFPDSPSPGLDQLFTQLITILPLLTYPFLPAAGQTGLPVVFFLIWPFMVLVALVQAVRFAELDFAGLHFETTIWQFLLVCVTLMLCTERLWIPSNREPQHRDFRHVTDIVLATCVYSPLYFFKNTLFSSGMSEPAWAAHVQNSLAVFVGLVFIHLVLAGCVRDRMMHMFFAFTTRRVSWWYWLPEHDCRESFGPWWSFLVAVFAASAPLVCAMAAATIRESARLEALH